MVQEAATDENREKQLVAQLELEFTDELGVSRALPTHSYCFDFAQWVWIPILAGEPEPR
jgi:hypothetical protein